MAVIFNIDEAIQRSVFNVYDLPIQMLLTNEIEAWEKESKLSKVFVMRTTDRYQEEYHSSSGMDGFSPTADMEPAHLSDFDEGYGKVFKTQIWTNSFAISKQAIEDNRDLDINAKAVGFVQSYGRTRENFGAAILAGGLAGFATYKNMRFDCTGLDSADGTLEGTKQTFFHKYHKTPLQGVAEDGTSYTAVSATDGYATALNSKVFYTKPQSNKFQSAIDFSLPKGVARVAQVDKDGKGQGVTATDALSNDQYLGLYDKICRTLGIVKSAFALHRSYKGEIVPRSLTRIVMPQDYILEDMIRKALASEYGANMGGFEIEVWPYLNNKAGFGASDHAFIMIDPVANQKNLGAVWFDRKALEVDSYIDKRTKANYWDGRARFQAGFGDWSAMAYVKCSTTKDTTCSQIDVTTGTIDGAIL